MEEKLDELRGRLVAPILVEIGLQFIHEIALLRLILKLQDRVDLACTTTSASS